MAKKKPRATATQRELAKVSAMIVRNAMEDFHVEHLSDDQMRQLNPIIRNAICTSFHMIAIITDDRIKAYFAFQKMLIPSYWEEPELLDEYVEIITGQKP
jgi:hypothetical protein